MKIEVGKLKIGDKVKIDNKDYQIVDFKTSDIGKHGQVKCRIEAINQEGKIIRVYLAKDIIEKL